MDLVIEDVLITGNMYVYAELKNPKWYHKIGLGMSPYKELKKWDDYEVDKRYYKIENAIKIINPSNAYKYKVGYYQ